MNKSKIIIGSDHGGFELKQKLKCLLEKKYIIFDVGTNSTDSCDYPNFAKKLCKEVLKYNCFGILICKTGVGMSIAANRFNKIRAVLCFEKKIAKMSRAHNNTNVICFGAENTSVKAASEMIDIFLKTGFEGDRHKRRVDMLDF
ncbi:MAG: ribose 5-phosphate isomerase B [Candidatus Aenigmarchaeota archaeon ex4484_52]|nr:MAG: ribose 5-phosphate isomerase B [Candidatus Aenigmarchaeota archaeon ex4484_52]